MNSEQLNAIRQRAEDTSFTSAYIKGDPWKGYEVKNEGNGIVIAETSTKADAEFIAHARQDVPALLAEVERLRKVIKYINELSDDFYTEMDANHVYSIPDNERHKATMQEIAVVSYETVNEDD
jgi:hypothetical protein